MQQKYWATDFVIFESDKNFFYLAKLKSKMCHLLRIYNFEFY